MLPQITEVQQSKFQGSKYITTSKGKFFFFDKITQSKIGTDLWCIFEFERDSNWQSKILEKWREFNSTNSNVSSS